MITPTAAVNLDALPELSTVAQVADLLQCRQETVLARIAAGVLPAVRVGEGRLGYFLVPRGSIDGFLKARIVVASHPRQRANRLAGAR